MGQYEVSLFFGHDQLVEMQRIINAENSDLFDVLAYVAYTLPPLKREERAARAKVAISNNFNNKEQAFLDSEGRPAGFPPDVPAFPQVSGNANITAMCSESQREISPL